MKEYFNFLKNLFNVSGRARRREYWVPTFINSSIMVCLYALFMFIAIISKKPFINVEFLSTQDMPKISVSPISYIFAIPIILWSLFTVVTTIPLLVRRCHDVGLGGFWAAICMVGYLFCGIGSIAQFIICILPSKEDNQYGPNPKSPENNEYKNISGIVVAILFYIVSCIVLSIGMGIYAAKLTKDIANNTELQDALSKLENNTSESLADIDEDEDFATTEAIDTEEVPAEENEISNDSDEPNADGTYSIIVGNTQLNITLPDIASDIYYSKDSFLQYYFGEAGVEAHISINESYIETTEDISSYLEDCYNNFFSVDSIISYDKDASMPPTETTINGHRACRFSVVSKMDDMYIYNCDYFIDIGAEDYLEITCQITSPEELSIETIDNLADLGI